MPAAEDRHDVSHRTLLRDALARERAADVVTRLRDRVTTSDWEMGLRWRDEYSVSTA